jgi:hypothetical protein
VEQNNESHKSNLVIVDAIAVRFPFAGVVNALFIAVFVAGDIQLGVIDATGHEMDRVFEAVDVGEQQRTLEAKDADAAHFGRLFVARRVAVVGGLRQSTETVRPRPETRPGVGAQRTASHCACTDNTPGKNVCEQPNSTEGSAKKG